MTPADGSIVPEGVERLPGSIVLGAARFSAPATETAPGQLNRASSGEIKSHLMGFEIFISGAEQDYVNGGSAATPDWGETNWLSSRTLGKGND